MKRKNKDKRTQRSKRKISDMLWAFAGDFIRLGTTQEQKQSHLNAACSAWNIACVPTENRQKTLDRFMVEYKRLNPHLNQTSYTDTRDNMEKLIQAKLKLFPTDVRQIVNAQVFSVGNQDRIEVASLTVS